MRHGTGDTRFEVFFPSVNNLDWLWIGHIGNLLALLYFEENFGQCGVVLGLIYVFLVSYIYSPPAHMHFRYLYSLSTDSAFENSLP